jgi:hypothetical protein
MRATVEDLAAAWALGRAAAAMAVAEVAVVVGAEAVDALTEIKAAGRATGSL